jgi:hypothetical protein
MFQKYLIVVTFCGYKQSSTFIQLTLPYIRYCHPQTAFCLSNMNFHTSAEEHLSELTVHFQQHYHLSPKSSISLLLFYENYGKQKNVSADISDKNRRSHKLNTIEIKKEIIKRAIHSDTLASTGHSHLSRSTACSTVTSNQSSDHLQDYNFVTHCLGNR